ncbi:MAG: deoxynucleoside kinase [Sphingobacteriales bacterium]|nr:MAG: deoxynucleoside kinase [Sphingobacteriales bacterium]
MSVSFRHIAIEGVIGAGKTTVARLLAEQLGGRLVLESFADNPFLPRFYAAPERYAFPLELSFLAERFQQLKSVISSPDLFRQPVVSDYIFQKSALFARINLDPAEYNLFQTMDRLIGAQLPNPDLLIYLNAPLQQLRSNIEGRGRDYEQTIPDAYLLKLGESYRQFLKEAPFPVLEIDMRTLDFLGAPESLKTLLKALNAFPWTGTHILEIV